MIENIDDLVAFLSRFHRFRSNAPTLPASAVGYDIPEGLRRIYLELGRLVAQNDDHGPFSTQDALVGVQDLKRIDGMLEFAWENQGNWSARCALSEKDPPVYSNALDVWNEEQRGFVVVCQSLNHFLITLCLQEAVLSCRNVVAIEAELPPADCTHLPLTPLWLNGYYVNCEQDHHFYYSEEKELLVMDYAGVWAGSNVSELTDVFVEGVSVKPIW